MILEVVLLCIGASFSFSFALFGAVPLLLGLLVIARSKRLSIGCRANIKACYIILGLVKI